MTVLVIVEQETKKEGKLDRHSTSINFSSRYPRETNLSK